MPEQTPADRIGRDDGTGHGPIVQVPAEQVSAMRSIVDANRRALGLPPQTADSDLRPWVMDLDGMWHRRPPGREWYLDRPDGAQAETVCGRWVPSVNVSEYDPCSEGSEWSCPGCAAAVSSAVPGEPTEGVPADPGATGKPAKVEVEHVMDDPNPPDWGGEETDEGTPIYHAAWDSQDGSARVWAGPYAGGLTDGWALAVEAETASVLLRCSTDQLIDWAESVRKAIKDSRANLQYVEQDGGS